MSFRRKFLLAPVALLAFAGLTLVALRPASGQVTARNMSYNGVLPPGGSTTIGFQATHTGNTRPARGVRAQRRRLRDRLNPSGPRPRPRGRPRPGSRHRRVTSSMPPSPAGSVSTPDSQAIVVRFSELVGCGV